LTLALLLTVALGAWAGVIPVSVAGNWLNPQWDATTNQMAYKDGVYSITFSNMPAGQNYEFKFALNNSWDESYGYSSTTAVELNKTLEIATQSGVDTNIKFDLAEACDVTISFNLTEPRTFMISTSGLVIGEDDKAPIKVAYNTAKTEATLEMPTSDVTIDYELVRDITQKVDVEVRIDGTATERIRIAKDGDGHYKFVTKQEWGWQFAAVDKLDNNKDLTNGELTYTLKMKEGNDYVAKNFDTDLCPGTWRLEATANAEKPYEGTAYGKDIELYTGYEVTVPAGEYATLFVKEAVVVDEGSTDAVLYTIANVTESEAQLSDAIKVAPKETPLLVYNKSEQDKTILLIPTTENADEVTPAKEFKGTLVEMEMPASSTRVDYYVCTGSAFMWVRDAGVIAANRCWLQIGEQPAASRAKTRSIVGGGDTTSLRGVNSEVVNSEDYYDLQGRKVAQPNRKGIYIKNGQKVIVR